MLRLFLDENLSIFARFRGTGPLLNIMVCWDGERTKMVNFTTVCYCIQKIYDWRWKNIHLSICLYKLSQISNSLGGGSWPPLTILSQLRTISAGFCWIVNAPSAHKFQFSSRIENNESNSITQIILHRRHFIVACFHFQFVEAVRCCVSHTLEQTNNSPSGFFHYCTLQNKPWTKLTDMHKPSNEMNVWVRMFNIYKYSLSVSSLFYSFHYYLHVFSKTSAAESSILTHSVTLYTKNKNNGNKKWLQKRHMKMKTTERVDCSISL